MESGQNNKQNVLVLSGQNPCITSGIVAMDLYRSLSKSPKHNVQLITGTPCSKSLGDPNISSLYSPTIQTIKHLHGKVQRQINRTLGIRDQLKDTDRNYAIQEFDLTQRNRNTQKIISRVNRPPDSIIVLFMQNFITFENLYELQSHYNAKLYLYLMDMGPMTGGCHYAWECRGYANTCGHCPAYRSEIKHDQSYTNWQFKNSFNNKLEMDIIVPSQLVEEQASRSSLFRDKKIHSLLIPVDSHVFKPRDMRLTRTNLGLNEDDFVIFFGANSVSEPRKGFAEMLKALQMVKEKLTKSQEMRVHLVIAGRAADLHELPFNHTLLGHLNHEQLAEVFSASDLFVCPSLEDSGPMMINQSILSGTPVVAFKTGVALNLVKDGKTGYTAESGNSNALGEAILQMLQLSNDQLDVLGKNCREDGMKLISLDDFHNRLSKIID